MPINATQKPIYESFSMLHPNGDFMCHISAKRAFWYVERDLATWVNDTTFKLKFEPKGKGKTDLPFYQQKLINRCVVCGDESENLNKHHVVPYVFRSRFPKEYKQSNHHDVLVTCINCHEKYEHAATQYKIELVKNSGLIMNEPMSSEEKHNRKVLSARKVLERVECGELKDEEGNVLIPEEKIKKLTEIAKLELYEVIESESAIWADEIVRKVIKEGKLFDFVKSWRQHFLDHAHPQFLPEHWSVEHDLEISSS